MLFDEVQPLFHLVVVFENQFIAAIVEVGAPRGFHDEAAPVGTAAGTEGGCHVRQFTVGFHRVVPRLKPVAVGVAHVVNRLQRHRGGVAVAAVAHALEVRTVHHVAAEGQALQCILNEVMDGVEARVGALEGGRFGGVERADG